MINTITLFPNGYKKTEKQPDYVASASEKVDGQWVKHKVGSAWIKTLKDGTQIVEIALNYKPYEKQDGTVIPAYEIVEVGGVARTPLHQPQGSGTPYRPSLNPQAGAVASEGTQPTPADDIPVIQVEDEKDADGIVIDDVPF